MHKFFFTFTQDYQKTPETIDAGLIEDRRTTVVVVNKVRTHQLLYMLLL